MIDQRNEHIHAFVRRMTVGRDKSHGYEHALAVMKEATELITPESEHLRDLVTSVALLHDVADHKYDLDGVMGEALENFLLEWFNSDAHDMLAVIEAISFSKEKLRGHRWYAENLSGDWLKVRDIVSDADKLQALGKVGFDRCLEYTRLLNDGITNEQALDAIIKHSSEKLFALPDFYIRTKSARRTARRRCIELMRCIVSFSDSL